MPGVLHGGRGLGSNVLCACELCEGLMSCGPQGPPGMLLPASLGPVIETGCWHAHTCNPFFLSSAAGCSLRELSLAGNLMSVSSQAAEQLALALPQLRCLLVSLPAVAAAASTSGARAGGGAGAAPRAAGEGGADAEQGGAGVAAQPAEGAHLEAMRHLAQALGGRLVLLEQ